MPRIRAAITMDDAPSVLEPGLPAEASHMDAIRETLQAAGVRHCVAFVIGNRAEGHESVLERWLRAGYELGNHTFDHCRAQEASVEHVVDSVRRCHALLESIGAFAGDRTRWFRFPYLSRGRDPAARTELHAEISRLGYRVAHATVDFGDHHFEHKLRDAVERHDPGSARAIGERYRNVACASVRFADARMRASLGRSVPLVVYCHFGWVSRQHLGAIVRRLQDQATDFCSLEEAARDAVYEEFERDHGRDGLLTQTLPRSTIERVQSALVRTSELADFADQHKLGPRWPYMH